MLVAVDRYGCLTVFNRSEISCIVKLLSHRLTVLLILLLSFIDFFSYCTTCTM